METRTTSRWSLVATAMCAMGLLWPPPGVAQTVSGHARAVQASTASTGSATLADTGTLGGPTDARESSASEGAIPSVLSGRTLHATTIGWSDQVSSEASIAGLAITVGGHAITADFVQARKISGKRTNVAVHIHGLTVDGNTIAVSGSPNQTITIAGGRIVIDERSGNTVNALHITIDGEADVVIASATASAQ